MATTIVFNHQIPHVEISGIYLNTSAVKKGGGLLHACISSSSSVPNNMIEIKTA
jgi:hypothetical protein